LPGFAHASPTQLQRHNASSACIGVGASITQELGQFSPTAFAGDQGQNCHVTYRCFQTAYSSGRLLRNRAAFPPEQRRMPVCAWEGLQYRLNR
jgi:hypothetical protein